MAYPDGKEILGTYHSIKQRTATSRSTERSAFTKIWEAKDSCKRVKRSRFFDVRRDATAIMHEQSCGLSLCSSLAVAGRVTNGKNLQFRSLNRCRLSSASSSGTWSLYEA